MTTAPNTALAVCNTAIREHNGLYSLNDLHKASGGEAKHQPALFMRLDTTQELIAVISNSTDVQSYVSRGGRYGGTYACRELVIAYAAWISAAFQLKVIRVFLDAAAPEQPAQQALPLPPAQEPAKGLSPTVAQEIAAQASQSILDALQRKHLLVNWPQVTDALADRNTEIQFSELTDLVHAGLARLQRSINAEAYLAIERRARRQNVRATHVSMQA